MLFFVVTVFRISILGKTKNVEVFTYIQDGKPSHMEIVTDESMDEVILEAYNEQNDLIHFFVLNDYVSKANIGLNKNVFFIANRPSLIEELNKIYLLKTGHKKYPLDIQVEEVDVYRGTGMSLDNIYKDGWDHPGDNRKIKVMSFNIHHGKSILGRDVLDEIAEIIRQSGADIVGLQELDKGLPRSRFRNQIQYLGQKLSMYYVDGYNLSLLGGRYGNGILSKYPIEDSENIFLPSKREQRGLLRADINIDGRRLNFLVTHLGLNKGERERQIRSINSYIDVLAYPVILTGDFNTSKTRDLDILASKLLDTGYIANRDKEATFNLPIMAQRIDYIFLDKNMKLIKYEVLKKEISDHYPVTATFIWD